MFSSRGLEITQSELAQYETDPSDLSECQRRWLSVGGVGYITKVTREPFYLHVYNVNVMYMVDGQRNWAPIFLFKKKKISQKLNKNFWVGGFFSGRSGQGKHKYF